MFISCLWDHKAAHSYTIFFPIITILIPCILVFCFYLKIYLYVKRSKIRVHSINTDSIPKTRLQTRSNIKSQVDIAKGLFSAFALFTISW